ncbi:MAG: 50S ribosomal protein L5 [Candidatus Omnitrophica bacterium]|nr:50S ribosomal protein L5 [Candidatus Omnitrophota bacterium]
MLPRLLERYRAEIVPSMMKKFNLKNRLEVPRLQKIVINMGVGPGAHDNKLIEQACSHLAVITGQRPVITKAHKAISNFKIRKDSNVGCKVTLRGAKMYEFFDRLISVALPRIRDFRGFSSNAFDQFGNYSLGLSEQTIFPEIEIDQVQKMQGMDVTIVTSLNNRELSFELLKEFGFPFR